MPQTKKRTKSYERDIFFRTQTDIVLIPNMHAVSIRDEKRACCLLFKKRPISLSLFNKKAVRKAYQRKAAWGRWKRGQNTWMLTEDKE